jgi:hypothetical protein
MNCYDPLSLPRLLYEWSRQEWVEGPNCIQHATSRATLCVSPLQLLDHFIIITATSSTGEHAVV